MAKRRKRKRNHEQRKKSLEKILFTRNKPGNREEGGKKVKRDARALTVGGAKQAELRRY